MLTKKEFHSPVFDDREELLGSRKFGVDWVGPQAEHELKLLRLYFHPPPRPPQYVTFELLDPPEGDLVFSSAPVEDYEYRGPAELRDEASAAFKCAITRRRQLAWAREALRLVDKYGERPTNGSEDFERLDHGDDRDMLREARRLIVATPNTDAIAGAAAEREAAPTFGPNVVLIKQDHKSTRARVSRGQGRGRPGKVMDRVKKAMLADLYSEKFTALQLKEMTEEAMKAEYGASRDTCRKACVAALSEMNFRQITTNDN